MYAVEPLVGIEHLTVVLAVSLQDTAGSVCWQQVQ